MSKTATRRIFAPAKVNLHLEVLARRDDGYHNIVSLFQMVSLCDELEIVTRFDADDCLVDGLAGVPPTDNLIVKAWQRFREAVPVKAGVAVRLDKRIPMAAGLGGGSSDAAASLKAFRSLYAPDLPDALIHDIAASVGSDVPFFLGAPAAVVTGRGEFLSGLPPRMDVVYLLAVPDLLVSTGEAFALLDRGPLPTTPRLSPSSVAERYGLLPPGEWGFQNSFRRVVEPLPGDVAGLVARLSGLGALYANLSGSGSAVFAVFDRAEKAEAARAQLTGGFRLLQVASPLENTPSVIIQ